MQRFRRLTCFLMAFAIGNVMYGQGKKGIDAAASELTTYIDPVGNLIMIIGAIVGLVGAIRVYLKWNSGDQDVQKAVMGWVGACIFLIVSGIIVKAFFGV